jgi:hypothetical protein
MPTDLFWIQDTGTITLNKILHIPKRFYSISSFKLFEFGTGPRLRWPPQKLLHYDAWSGNLGGKNGLSQFVFHCVGAHFC